MDFCKISSVFKLLVALCLSLRTEAGSSKNSEAVRTVDWTRGNMFVEFYGAIVVFHDFLSLF